MELAAITATTRWSRLAGQKEAECCWVSLERIGEGGSFKKGRPVLKVSRPLAGLAGSDFYLLLLLPELIFFPS